MIAGEVRPPCTQLKRHRRGNGDEPLKSARASALRRTLEAVAHIARRVLQRRHLHGPVRQHRDVDVAERPQSATGTSAFGNRSNDR